jgi:nucleoside 2-deoxyribosyltransferase
MFWELRCHMRVYFAAPLFSQAERSWNALVASIISSLGHEVMLPQNEIQALGSLEADRVFQNNVENLRSADAVIAIVDGSDPDSGTSFECGLAYAMKIPIVAVRTDFRGGGDALPGQRLSTVNLMLSQAAAHIVTCSDPSSSPKAIALAVCKALSALQA